MSDRVREGGCGCGQVRYRVTGEPIFVNNCHCRQCQQQTGGTSVVNAFYEEERLEILEGDLTEHVVTAGSGGPHTICRCDNCGVALWSYYPRLGRLGVGIRVGTMDEKDSLTPVAAIFVSEKMPWVTLPQGLPHFDKTYDYRELLEADKIARMDEMIKRRKAGD